MAGKKSRRDASEVFRALAEYPLFCRSFEVEFGGLNFTVPLPMAVGTYWKLTKELDGRFPHIKKWRYYVALWVRMHAQSTHYLLALLTLDSRYDLQGNLAGAVCDSHKTYARSQLNPGAWVVDPFQGNRRRYARSAKKRVEDIAG